MEVEVLRDRTMTLQKHTRSIVRGGEPRNRKLRVKEFFGFGREAFFGYFLRCLIRARIRLFFRPTLRRPRPVFLTPTNQMLLNQRRETLVFTTKLKNQSRRRSDTKDHCANQLRSLTQRIGF
jgi:hypothetical protein